MKKILIPLIISLCLFCNFVFAEAKYKEKKPLMQKKWSRDIGNNLSWVAGCGERKFKSKIMKEIKSLSKYDYRNLMRGIADGTGTGNKVAIGCSGSAIF